MCGIVALLRLDRRPITKFDIDHCGNAVDLLRHRGPDGVRVTAVTDQPFVLGHSRLAIVDVKGGDQPFVNSRSALSSMSANVDLYTVANGEIYNHEELRREKLIPTLFKTKSDCEVIPGVFERVLSGQWTIADAINQLDGVFGFVTIDTSTGNFIAARDAIGVFPLFYCEGDNCNTLIFASEAKAFEAFPNVERKQIHEMPAGHYISGNLNTGSFSLQRWYTDLQNDRITHSKRINVLDLRSLVQSSVRKRMMTDVPFGVLLSGGLDSSIVASCVVEETKARGGHAGDVQTFSVGLADSPDLAAARIVAEHLGTRHRELVITPEQVIEDLDNTIWCVESFDVATIRSAIPMKLLAKFISNHGIKMVLGGDGADEIFAGYEYFQYAPNETQLHLESLRKVNSLSRYDCKRGNHAMMAHGVEYRCPYLDKALVRYMMAEVDPFCKMWSRSPNVTGIADIEKFVLRQAFDQDLPTSIAWRRKVQFSAGCGDAMIQALIANADEQITDAQYSDRTEIYPTMTPLSKEAFLYRRAFEELLPGCNDIVTYEPSLNCSTKYAFDWFPLEISDNFDPCGIKFAPPQRQNKRNATTRCKVAAAVGFVIGFAVTMRLLI